MLKVRERMFFVFGDRDLQAGGLKLISKLPISAGMVRDLCFVQECAGWKTQHDWVIAHFDAEGDILAELPTLRGWMRQSDCAVAPKKLARQARGEA